MQSFERASCSTAARLQGGGLVVQCLLLSALIAVVLLLTESIPPGDGLNYAATIADNLGKLPFGPQNPLWEFGHLLWRPIGWIGATTLSPLLSPLTHWTGLHQALFVLTIISVFSTVAATVLWHLMMLDLGVPWLVSLLTALALMFANGFVFYSHTALAYSAGVSSLTASVYLVRKRRIWPAALFYALASLIWLPYILAGPALAVLVVMPDDWRLPVWSSRAQLRIEQAIRFGTIGLTTIAVVYVLAAVARETHSFGELKALYLDASHGWNQHYSLIRLGAGLPRLMLDMGNDGITWKRFMHDDPFTQVALWDLLRSNVWRSALFYLFVAAMLYDLFRHWRWTLVLVLAAMGPVTLFSVFLFETSAAERFLPALPFLVIAVGCILQTKGKRNGFRVAQVIVVGFLVVIVANNGCALAASRLSQRSDVSLQRLGDLRVRLSDRSILVVLSNRDEVCGFLERALLGSDSGERQPLIRLYDVIEAGTSRLIWWREHFASTVLSTWDRGGEVWVSKRLWAEVPRSEWNWVERDGPLEVWADVNRFYKPLRTDLEVGGTDGFARLSRSEDNLRYLMSRD